MGGIEEMNFKPSGSRSFNSDLFMRVSPVFCTVMLKVALSPLAPSRRLALFLSQLLRQLIQPEAGVFIRGEHFERTLKKGGSSVQLAAFFVNEAKVIVNIGRFRIGL